MKTAIITNFGVVNNFIKDALSDLQTLQIKNHTWYKGKFYTKELYLVEITDNQQVDLDELLDILVIDCRVTNIISLGLAIPSLGHIRPGDVLICDFPKGSCQQSLDLFLNEEIQEEEPLRIFAGVIGSNPQAEGDCDILACRDENCDKLFTLTTQKGLSSLAIRIMIPEAEGENLDIEIMNTVIQKILIPLKKSLEIG